MLRRIIARGFSRDGSEGRSGGGAAGRAHGPDRAPARCADGRRHPQQAPRGKRLPSLGGAASATRRQPACAAEPAQGLSAGRPLRARPGASGNRRLRAPSRPGHRCGAPRRRGCGRGHGRGGRLPPDHPRRERPRVSGRVPCQPAAAPAARHGEAVLRPGRPGLRNEELAGRKAPAIRRHVTRSPGGGASHRRAAADRLRRPHPSQGRPLCHSDPRGAERE